jgi:GC-rich sequence DNA-binding factor
VETLRETSRRHESDADRAVDDLVESRSEIARLEEEMPRLAGRYRVFQQLRGYISDLVDCFDEKVLFICLP